MGVLNVTPDSFSDGGRWADVDAALAHGRRLAADGADLVDVGGESTRPGARRPDVAEELDRVLPVVAGLAADGVAVSVDTMRAEVAAAAVEAGATVVNDVSGGLADPGVLDVVAGADADLVYVAMHWRAHSHEMTGFASYDGPGGVVGGVVAELGDRLAAATKAGVPEDRVVLDPGLGFAKTGEHNWDLLAALDELSALGRPLLVGASRKSFLGSLLADPDTGAPRSVGEREAANVAVSTLAAQAGAWGLRVHDVRATLDAVAVVRRWRQAAPDRA
ncbi:dihydropteroate synthase [Nocardioides sp. CFH 31398]|uniref:dihydropteroate synthase n=1 Tax=Nocardioides sp. CFH 31398 TaxID=2919579 RepID=UPI001F05703A|nr:dihydropteroate synthase [Nocardioides sp. CFH 31398]MCH1866143.1 dihydropteroate synthase [Nocardioides sp. CFH 31398]